MTDDEKVLGFAGFTKPGGITIGDWHPVVPTTPHTAIFWRHNETGEELTSNQIDAGTLWMAPDGRPMSHCPDTADPTWLFKWCVPKLQEQGYELRIYTGQKGADAHCLVIKPPFGQVTGIKQAPTPGEALRAAIVSNIGEGE